MSQESQVAIRPTASQSLALFIGMDRDAMLQTFKAQCFRNANNVSDEQLAAFVSIASEMKVNPLLPGMLYAYPTSGGGIIPIMGPDGVYKKLSEHAEVDSWETIVYPDDNLALPPTHAITKIWRKGRERPLQFTALLSEWKIGNNPNWSTRPRHMLGLRSLKQCARQIIHGIPGDEDDRHIQGEINVTDTAAPAAPEVQRAPAPTRAKKGANAAAAPAEKPIEVAATTVAETPKAPEPAPAPSVDEEIARQANTGTPTKAAEPTTTGTTAIEGGAGKGSTPTQPKTDAPASGRAFLQPGETIHVDCTVKEVRGINAKVKEVDTPSVQVMLDGGYVGKAFHFGGARLEGTAYIPATVWTPGTAVKVQLTGNKNPKTNTVYVSVDSVAAVAPALAAEMEVG